MMRDNKGFTLIELLIVVVIIGILAAIAIPKFSQTREKAYYSAMKSDLKNLATQQEIYYSDGNYSYSDDETNTDLGFSASDAVEVDVQAGTSTGWNATATHEGLAATEGCAVHYGDAGVPGTVPTDVTIAADDEGVIQCSD